MFVNLKNGGKNLPNSKRIRARAIRRCGELLSLFDGRNGQNLPNTKSHQEVNFSKRIKARAQRRCYELISIFDGQGKRNDLELHAHKGSKLTKREVAQQAGISEKQQRNINNMYKKK